ncbi:hypothetical protein [Thermocrispum municipale]|uniref:hypothetical protein n=1 Tax=Thermocrispum municipale TaxID=37926 RepID=UPI0004186C7B|nr:hypothetical protein [Thermocrispum municipale]
MHAYRWWYFAAAVIMAIAVAAFYIAVQAYPDSLGGAAWPGLLVSVLLLAGAVFRLRVTDSPMARAERAALAAAAGLSLLTVALQAFVLADGLSVWAVVVGALPALPFLPLAWQAERTLSAEPSRS